MKNQLFNRKVLFSLLAVVMYLGWTAMSYGQAVVSVEPAEVASPAAGEELTVSINIAGGADVTGFQVTVNFDAAALTYEAGAVGDYLPAGAFPIITPGDGSVTIAATAIGAAAAAADGTLATVTFTVVEAKASAITLTDILLSDAAANSLDVTSMDGAVTVTAAEGEAPVVETDGEPIDEVELIEGPSEEPAVAEEPAIDGAVALGVVNIAGGPLAEDELLVDPMGISVDEDHSQVKTWITKWYGPDGNYENNGGFAASTLPGVAYQGAAATRDLMDEGTGGTITDASLSTLQGLLLTQTTDVEWGNNHGGTRGWTVFEIDPMNSDNMDRGGPGDYITTYGVIVIDAPRPMTAVMSPAHDDVAQIWLNGEKWYNNSRWTGGATWVRYNVEIQLRKGANVLVFRCGEWRGEGYMNLHFDNATHDEITVYPKNATDQQSFFDEIRGLTLSELPLMYWVDISSGRLFRSTRTTAENIVPNVQNATGIAMHAAQQKIYWMEKTGERSGKIRRANLDGSNVQLVKELTSVPRELTLDTVQNKLYLTNSWGKIQRMNFDGSGFQPNLITGLNEPKHLAVDISGGKVYWTEPGSIWRANLNGKNREQLLTNLGELGGLAIANGRMYWTEQNKHNQTIGRVRRATLTGSHVTTLATLMSVPMGIAVDPAGRRLYWTNSRGRIQRASLTGEHLQNVVTGLGMPASLALGVAPEVGTLVAAPAALGTVAVGKTGLLPNYPNPFNPETWIPYELAEAAEVTVTIHAADGKLVRTLALGQLPAGVYQTRTRAAYWDGRNAQGEPVASGIYFYTLQAGDFSATRKMVIRK